MNLASKWHWSKLGDDPFESMFKASGVISGFKGPWRNSRIRLDPHFFIAKKNKNGGYNEKIVHVWNCQPTIISLVPHLHGIQEILNLIQDLRRDEWMHISSGSASPRLRPATLLFPTPGNAKAGWILGCKKGIYGQVSPCFPWKNVEPKQPDPKWWGPVSQRFTKNKKTYSSRNS